jgi:hypothetical protein
MKRLLLAAATALLIAAPDLQAATAVIGSNPSDAVISSLVRQAPGLRTEVLRMALDAAGAAAEKGLVKRRDLLTVIDYSLPSSEPRLFVFDLGARKLLFRELVAHGKNSGGDRTTNFSNMHGSLATSMGLFVTAGTYYGSNGYSLRLRGLERGVNDNAMERAIVMHGASYVSRAAVKALGRLGRSWGCPAVRKEVARKMIDTLRGGSPIFAYYPEKKWLTSSAFLRGSSNAVAIASNGGGSSSVVR